MKEARIAFSSEVAFDRLTHHAQSRDWEAETPSEYPVPGTEPLAEDSYTYTWKTKLNGIARFVDDEVTEVQYFILRGEDSSAEADALSRTFMTTTHTECLESLAGNISAADRERGLEVLGVIAPREFKESVYETVKNGLASDLATVRAAAISAAIQLYWAEFRPSLQIVSTSDPDPNNRALSSNALHALPPSQ
ncbi:hypothetical protein AB0891_19570 [Streptomyces sp. NPDC007259]|uniref:hypothetical protein n=1 Tax=Streptomyces sp. NPDC007259 TaxID=3154319 RepID=UPI0034525AC3